MIDDDMDTTFHALAHRARRLALDLVKARPGCSVNDVCEHFTISRIAVMKHLGILEEAGLLKSEKVGRVRRLYFNAVPIQLVYDRWTDEYSSFWASKMADWKYELEKEHAKNVRNERERGLHDPDQRPHPAGVERDNEHG
jgi:predicted transcriptional regulator